jgi:Ca2+-binding RTX toxin-like protein
LTHELGHAVLGLSDNDTMLYEKGDNVVAVNRWFKQLGFGEQASYEAYDIGSHILVPDRDYTGGKAIINSIIDISPGSHLYRGDNTSTNGANLDLTASGVIGSTLIVGGIGNNTYVGTASADWIYGGGGNDFLSGGAGNDTLVGENGNDLLMGGSIALNRSADGIDTADYRFDFGVSIKIGGAAVDNTYVGNADYAGIDFSAAVFVTNPFYGTTDTLISIERISGSAYGDTLIIDTLTGGQIVASGQQGGISRIDLAGSNDDLVDMQHLDEGVNATLNVASWVLSGLTNTTSQITVLNAEKFIATQFNDRIVLNANNLTVNAFNGNDTIILNGSGEHVFGGNGTDTFTVRGADAIISGGFGANVIDARFRATDHSTLGDARLLHGVEDGLDKILSKFNFKISTLNLTNRDQLLGSYYDSTGIAAIDLVGRNLSEVKLVWHAALLDNQTIDNIPQWLYHGNLEIVDRATGLVLVDLGDIIGESVYIDPKLNDRYLYFDNLMQINFDDGQFLQGNESSANVEIVII